MHFRKTILSIIACSLICFTSLAQKEVVDNNGPYIGVTGGLGVPFGEFGGSSGSGIYTGEFAQIGMAWNVTASYPLYKGLHAILNAGYNYNKFNLSAYVAQLPEGNNIATSATAYNAENLLAGLGYMFLANNKLSIDIKLVAGGFLFSTPDVQYYKIAGRGDYNILSASKITVAIKPSFDVLYNLSSKLNCVLDLTLLYSQFSISTTELYGYAPSWISNTGSNSITVSMFEASLGINYKLGN